jgi:hypothetical protein
MFKIYSLITFLFFLVFISNGQTTLILQPNGDLGKDAFISSNVLDAGQGNSTEFDAGAWTIFGEPLAIRSLIDFDLSSLPFGATIQSAQLTLYNNPNAQNANANGQHVHVSGSNEAVLQRILTPWAEDVAWSNQPTTTSQNEVTLAQDTDPYQDYILDVTNLILDNLTSPSNSFGFLLKLKNESPYRFLAFASSDHQNSAIHPKLEITYTLDCNMLTLQPDEAAGKDAFISSNVLNDGQGNSTEFDAGAWTIFGEPLAIRSLIDFDLSNLPVGATIQSAQLTLYNNPNAQNGYANGQHVHVSGSNEAVLQRIITPWTEDVAWSNQPTTTSQNEVTLDQDSDPYQDYILDVTNLLLDNLASPSNSFGFLLKLKNEYPYRLLAFASSDYPNPSLHPKLEICYSNLLTINNQVLQNNNVAVFPNPTTGIIHVELKNMNTTVNSYNSFFLFDAIGNKVFESKNNSKSSLLFDFSSLQNGMYYWVLNSSKINTTGKLILTK